MMLVSGYLLLTFFWLAKGDRHLEDSEPVPFCLSSGKMVLPLILCGCLGMSVQPWELAVVASKWLKAVSVAPSCAALKAL